MITARELRDLVEPVAATVYFAPESKEAYEKLGLTFIPGYFCSRSACLGKLPGESVAAIFGSFNPEIVTAAVKTGWSLTEPSILLEARLQSATAAIKRVFSSQSMTLQSDSLEQAATILKNATDAVSVDGRPLFAALRSLPWPEDPIGALFRGCDLVRERRGESHISAWVSSGLEAVEVLILTELWYGVPSGSSTHTRGWSQVDIQDASTKLIEKGFLSEDGLLTDLGRQARDSVEDATDRAEQSLIDSIGDQEGALVSVLEQATQAIIESGEAGMYRQTLQRPTVASRAETTA
jgi:hypothetical protein